MSESFSMLKAKDWREETLSAKNRLFKLLTSTSRLPGSWAYPLP